MSVQIRPCKTLLFAKPIVVAIALCHSGALLALDNITINGFGSVVAGIADEPNTFRNSNYDSLLEFTPDSRFAVQMTADLDQGLSATIQVLAEGEDSFQPVFEWAYLSYQVADRTWLRGGRLRVPFYKYSDFLDVGYAYTFVRPPAAMYSIQFSTFDGLSLLHNFSLGSVDFALNMSAGNVSDTFYKSVEPTDGKLENLIGVHT